MKSSKLVFGKAVFLAILLVCSFLAITARAELQVSGNLVYDTITGRTWLKDANYAKTSGYHATGRMTWAEAQTFIASLNAASHEGHSDWRLPDAHNLDGTGPNLSVSGCGGTIYTKTEMGNTEHGSLWKNYSINEGPVAWLLNYQNGALYWTGTERGSQVYVFGVFGAQQTGYTLSLSTKGTGNCTDQAAGYAWPVRTGAP